jgi:thioredoxin reductase (NADPH)
MTITTDVENYPGFADVIQGPWLMDQMEVQATKVGTEIVDDVVVDVDLVHRPFIFTGDSGTTYAADALIIATGASARWLGRDFEEKYRGFGVSACATCDGFFYRGKTVLVVGGGNTAVEEALFLTNFASQVYLVHRRDELRAEKTMQDRLMAESKISIIWNSILDDVAGVDNPPGITSACIRNVITGEVRELPVEGIFVAIGHDPNTELFRGQLDVDNDGYLITLPDSTATNMEGVFAAGDVMDKTFRQAVTAAGTGCMAALETEKFLAGH